MQTEKNKLIPTLQAPFSMEDFMATLAVLDMALDSPKANHPDYRSYIQTQLRELYLKADEFDLFTSDVVAKSQTLIKMLNEHVYKGNKSGKKGKPQA